MLCLMFDSEQRGYLGEEDRPWSIEEIALAIGGPYDVALNAVQEVLAKSVFRLNKSGCVYSKRLLEYEDLRKNRSISGKKGNKKRWDSNRSQNDRKVIAKCSQNGRSSSSSSSSKLKTLPTEGSEGSLQPERVRRTNARLERFCALFEQRFGHTYTIGNYAEMGASAKRTEAKMNDAEFEDAIAAFFECKDQRIVDAGHPFNFFIHELHRWAMAGKKPKTPYGMDERLWADLLQCSPQEREEMLIEYCKKRNLQYVPERANA